MSLLKIENLSAHHGQLAAVRDVTIELDAGEVVALVGANGAGKTTLFRTVAGVHRASSGRVLLDGEDMTGKRAYQRTRSGIAMVPEGRRLFGDMSVTENLKVAGDQCPKGAWTLERVFETFPQLKPVAKSLAGVLSGGQRQAVAIGRALMSNPRILLLDEASLGLSPVAIEGLYINLQKLRATKDVAMIVVEQDLDRAIAFSDRLACLLEGKIMLAGVSNAISREAITQAYFGIETASHAASREAVQ